MKFKVEVIIVNWNTKDLTVACVESVLFHSDSNDIHVTVVDNASDDGSVEYLTNRFPLLTVIANAENVGFAKANNQVIASSQAEYFVLLNSDTYVTSDALGTLIDAMEKNPTIGAIGPSLPQPQGRIRVHSCGYFPGIRTAIAHYFGLTRLPLVGKYFKGINLLQSQTPFGELVPVDWLSGACLVVRSSVVEQCGPLDEGYFMYSEDVEWCQRIKAGGWEVALLPDASVYHYLGASGEQSSPSTLWVENLVNFYKRSNSNFKAAIFALVVGTGLVARGVLLKILFWATMREKWGFHSLVMLRSGRRSLSMVGQLLAE